MSRFLYVMIFMWGNGVGGVRGFYRCKRLFRVSGFNGGYRGVMGFEVV
mgnify:CR=1 FL=1